jgi:hypothetical protein
MPDRAQSDPNETPGLGHQLLVTLDTRDPHRAAAKHPAASVEPISPAPTIGPVAAELEAV